jgi:AAA domain
MVESVEFHRYITYEGRRMMKLVLLFGPQAVGKMTVGQELERKTGLKLFHNHMTIELLQPFFGFSEEMWRISGLMREEIFEAYSKTDQYGMVFTFMWAFNEQEDWKWVDKVTDIFESNGSEVYFVELESDLDVRLKRNVTPNRLKHKPSKRNVEDSEKRLLASLDRLRLNSNEGEIDKKNYMKIDNSNLSPEEVAEMIIGEFQL